MLFVFPEPALSSTEKPQFFEKVLFSAECLCDFNTGGPIGSVTMNSCKQNLSQHTCKACGQPLPAEKTPQPNYVNSDSYTFIQTLYQNFYKLTTSLQTY